MSQFLVQGDTGSTIEATLTRNDTGQAMDLSNDVVVLKVRAKNTTTTLFTVTGSATTGELMTGLIRFNLGSNLDSLSGYYEAEIEITHQDTTVESVYELIDIVVRTDFT